MGKMLEDDFFVADSFDLIEAVNFFFIGYLWQKDSQIEILKLNKIYLPAQCRLLPVFVKVSF